MTTWSKDLIRIRRILSRMKYHTKVKYSGPLILYSIKGRYLPDIIIGEDYEFYDYVYREWDSPRAFIHNSSTRKQMNDIISILNEYKLPAGIIITKWNVILPLKRVK